MVRVRAGRATCSCAVCRVIHSASLLQHGLNPLLRPCSLCSCEHTSNHLHPVNRHVRCRSSQCPEGKQSWWLSYLFKRCSDLPTLVIERLTLSWQLLLCSLRDRCTFFTMDTTQTEPDTVVHNQRFRGPIVLWCVCLRVYQACVCDVCPTQDMYAVHPHYFQWNQLWVDVFPFYPCAE